MKDIVHIDIKQSTADPISRDLGNWGVLGRWISKTIQLPMFTMNENAVWAGNRILSKWSYPFGTFRLTLNRQAFRLEPGDCFKLFYAPYGIQGVICRVVWVEEEDPTSEKINVYAIEDLFALTKQVDVYTIPPDRTIGRVDYTARPFSYQMIIEPTFTLSDEVGVVPLVCRESPQDLGFEVYMSLDDGYSYSLIETSANMFPFGLLDGEYPDDTYTIDTTVGFVVKFIQDVQWVESATWPDVFSGQNNLALLTEEGGYHYEVISFKDITPIEEPYYKISNVIRGRSGTTKLRHPHGTHFYVLGSGAGVVLHPEITVGAARLFKFVPYNRKQTGEIQDCRELDIYIRGLPLIPYRPTNFAANNKLYAARYDDDIVLTWSPRHRKRGAGIGLPGRVAPSSDWEGMYKVEVWVYGALKRTVLGIDGLTWTYTAAMNIEDNGFLAPEVLFKLFNYRSEDGVVYESDPAEIRCKKN